MSSTAWPLSTPLKGTPVSAAVKEGILPGGGVALIRCQKSLDALKAEGEKAPRYPTPPGGDMY